jgi:hypothetical protein
LRSDARQFDFRRRPAIARRRRLAGSMAALVVALAVGAAVRGLSSGAAMTTGEVALETVVATADWRIPAPDRTTRIQLGLRITNRTGAAARFTSFDTLRPALRDPNGRPIAIDGGRDRTLVPDVQSSPLLAPGESVFFRLDAALYWRDGTLRLGGSDGFGGLWYFAGLKPGRYEIRIGYSQKNARLVLGTPGARALDEFWIGEAAGSPVMVTITPAQPP